MGLPTIFCAKLAFQLDSEGPKKTAKAAVLFVELRQTLAACLYQNRPAGPGKTTGLSVPSLATLATPK
ncbi:hypothetical protein FHS30_001055 [Simiduia aestuariiviva]|uniref:Uncharacterized protein n=1 Tax=Simiduia aestuariiviva TaxID=1510459 RepID=A0A839UMV5_9GAMM|nr:hypothetical protein [Simiduia aestuariiviva]